MRALSRKTASRKSLLRNLATSLVLYERIQTTEAKAKEVKSVVEHLLYLAKKNDLASRRRMLGYFFDKNATKKVLEVLLPRYDKLSSGFIKTYRKGKRLGDGAMIMILEFKKMDSVNTGIEKEEVKEISEIIKEGQDDSSAKKAKNRQFGKASITKDIGAKAKTSSKKTSRAK